MEEETKNQSSNDSFESDGSASSVDIDLLRVLLQTLRNRAGEMENLRDHLR
jgi:hypothetical protein